MRAAYSLLACSLAGVLLTGCFERTDTKKVTCSDESGLGVVKTIITERAEKTLKNEYGFEVSSVRASLDALNIDITGIRTAKQDPNSTKVFCEAEFNIGVPVSVINDVSTAMEAAEMGGDMNSMMEEFGYQQSSTAANTYHGTISYNLQPSDDGQHIFAQLEEGMPEVAMAEILYWSMSKNSLVAEAESEKRLMEEEEARIAQEEKERQDAITAKETAELERAKIAYDKAVERLNATWNGFDEETKEALRPEQRAINKEREASCKANSLDIDGSAAEKEVYRLYCEVEEMDNRNAELSELSQHEKSNQLKESN